MSSIFNRHTDKSVLLAFQFSHGNWCIGVFSNKLNVCIFLENHSGMERAMYFCLVEFFFKLKFLVVQGSG